MQKALRAAATEWLPNRSLPCGVLGGPLLESMSLAIHVVSLSSIQKALGVWVVTNLLRKLK